MPCTFREVDCNNSEVYFSRSFVELFLCFVTQLFFRYSVSAILKIFIGFEICFEIFAIYVVGVFSINKVFCCGANNFHVTVWVIFCLYLRVWWGQTLFVWKGIFFFFEFMTFLLLLKVKFMVLFAVVDLYRLDGAGRGTQTILN